MGKSLIMSFTRVMLFAIILAFVPGCVVQQIHDDLAATRAGVERLAPVLEQTKSALDSSNIQLESLHAQLAATHHSLGLMLIQMETTNAQLRQSVQQLNHLEPMMVSIKNLDESLAALRKNIENIDKAIPLINVSKGTPPADRVLKRQEDERANEERPPLPDNGRESSPGRPK